MTSHSQALECNGWNDFNVVDTGDCGNLRYTFDERVKSTQILYGMNHSSAAPSHVVTTIGHNWFNFCRIQEIIEFS